MNRRGFFAAVFAAPAVAAVPLPAPAAPVPVATFVSTPYVAYEVIHAALRLLGVLAPGQFASQADIDAALFHFRGLLWERPWISQSQLSIALARRLAPQYCIASVAVPINSPWP